MNIFRWKLQFLILHCMLDFFNSARSTLYFFVECAINLTDMPNPFGQRYFNAKQMNMNRNTVANVIPLSSASSPSNVPYYKFPKNSYEHFNATTPHELPRYGVEMYSPFRRQVSIKEPVQPDDISNHNGSNLNMMDRQIHNENPNKSGDVTWNFPSVKEIQKEWNFPSIEEIQKEFQIDGSAFNLTSIFPTITETHFLDFEHEKKASSEKANSGKAKSPPLETQSTSTVQPKFDFNSNFLTYFQLPHAQLPAFQPLAIPNIMVSPFEAIYKTFQNQMVQVGSVNPSAAFNSVSDALKEIQTFVENGFKALKENGDQFVNYVQNVMPTVSADLLRDMQAMVKDIPVQSENVVYILEQLYKFKQSNGDAPLVKVLESLDKALEDTANPDIHKFLKK